MSNLKTRNPLWIALSVNSKQMSQNHILKPGQQNTSSFLLRGRNWVRTQQGRNPTDPESAGEYRLRFQAATITTKPMNPRLTSMTQLYKGQLWGGAGILNCAHNTPPRGVTGICELTCEETVHCLPESEIQSLEGRGVTGSWEPSKENWELWN